MRKSFWENLVLTAIVLVIVQTFLDDFSVVAGWSWPVRRVLLVSGFCFDMFFTGEFFVRLYAAAINRKTVEYIVHERGWVDFLASVPLAVFNSGPAVFGLAAGVGVAAFGGGLNVLKVIKAVRIARILRMLRVLKIFRQIKNAESVMAQRHIAKIAGVSVTVFVFSLLGFQAVQSLAGGRFLEGMTEERYAATADAVVRLSDDRRTEGIKTLAGIEPGLLLVKQDGKVLFSRFDSAYYAKNFGLPDYSYLKEGSLEFFFDLRPVAAQQSRDSLTYLVVIVVLLSVILLYYSPHFALTVTDPIHVMYRGFTEPGYNLEAKIPKRFRDDDVYRLADRYNEEFLPLKCRTVQAESPQGLELKVEDFGDLLKKG